MSIRKQKKLQRTRQKKLRRALLMGASFGATVLCAGTTTSAWAQDNSSDAANAAANAKLEEVTVTGTRIRRNDFTAPNATTVVTSKDMFDLGVFTAAQMIQQLPNNIATESAETSADGPLNNGRSIANLRGLNTRGGTRTLTLLNSRRLPATTNGGAVDLNTLPQALIRRVETITGGASATYGADALAGVVNVLLDEQKDDITVDVSYGETSEGDGGTTAISIGGGTDVLGGRGHVVVGLDHRDSEAINDCTSRDYCAKERGIIQNGSGFSFFGTPYIPRFFAIDPTKPQYIITEGLHYTTPTTGMIFNPQTDPATGFPVDTTMWAFDADGKGIHQIYQDLNATQTAFLRNVGALGVSPYGEGPGVYKNVPLRTGLKGDNLYTHFDFNVTDDITFDVALSYDKSEGRSNQNSARDTTNTIDIRADNGFLWQPGVAPAMRNEILDRMDMTVRAKKDVFGNPILDANGDLIPGQTVQGTCGTAPYLGPWGQGGGLYGPASPGTDDPVPCYEIDKILSDQLTRTNIADTNVKRFVVGLKGKLFDNWSWDTYGQYSKNESNTRVENWQSNTRRIMALDAFLDPATGQVVCRTSYDDPTNPNDEGDIIRQKWLTYYDYANGENAGLADAQHKLQSLSAGCQPLNPFGYAASPESLAFAYPAIEVGVDTTLKTYSFNFTGDFWKGIGAGTFALASGMDWVQQTTQNTQGTDNPAVAGDFDQRLGDPYAGVTTNTEVWAELNLPLLKDKFAAKSLLVDVGYRRTHNKAERTAGGPPAASERYVNSWKANIVWAPLKWMTVRMTRSQDTRAPSAEELFSTASPGTNASGVWEFENPFRKDNLATPAINEANDQMRIETFLAGGNAALAAETAKTDDFGLVFQPEILGGLQVAVDYYKTSIVGGIERIFPITTLNNCAAEVTALGAPGSYCSQITFGPPDPTQAGIPGTYAPFTDIQLLNGSQVNSSPFWSRGIDYSVRHLMQLDGGGVVSSRILVTQYLEQSVASSSTSRMDVVGQTGQNQNSTFGPSSNFTPTPKIQANAWVTYAKKALSVTGQIRYIGKGELNIQNGWLAPGECGKAPLPFGQGFAHACYDLGITNTVTYNDMPSWMTFNLNFTYDFARSGSMDHFSSMMGYINISNVFDKVPNFYSGTGAGGINATYYSGIGRNIRLGVRMEF